MRRKFAIGAALVAALAAAATTYALAASGASTAQTINACVDDAGHVRLVSAAGNCKRGESPLDWNTIGPAGAAGPQGVPGRDGTSAPPPDSDAVQATISVTGQKHGAFSANPIAVIAVSHEIVSP